MIRQKTDKARCFLNKIDRRIWYHPDSIIAHAWAYFSSGDGYALYFRGRSTVGGRIKVDPTRGCYALLRPWRRYLKFAEAKKRGCKNFWPLKPSWGRTSVSVSTRPTYVEITCIDFREGKGKKSLIQTDSISLSLFSQKKRMVNSKIEADMCARAKNRKKPPLDSPYNL